VSSASDTICAIATPPGRGGVGIIRISGTGAYTLALSLTQRSELTPRHAHFCSFFDHQGKPIDSGIALFFNSPSSFTGEDVVEIQSHGSPVVMQQLLHELCRSGARIAEPGEFSKRAFLNDKIDLIQAEAIADIINASTDIAARNAHKSLQGAFSDYITDLLARIINLRILIEAGIDFPDEDIEFAHTDAVQQELSALITLLKTTLRTAQIGQIIQTGITVALIGAPNAGKSSLLNQLSGLNKAIVTDIPGTTRDTLDTSIDIDGIPFTFVDTAGLRDTTDTVEQAGIAKALDLIDSADIVLFIIDATTLTNDTYRTDELLSPALSERLTARPFLAVINKIDLSTTVPTSIPDAIDVVSIAAKHGTHLDLLKRRLIHIATGADSTENALSARQRHISGLQGTLDSLEYGLEHFLTTRASELLAEDLRRAQDRLNEITGRFSADDLLGEIFSHFCIGK
jgi:tRNA modification GTPase